ncbi:MAG: hypothetical protein JW940_33485 [Polyangiaceae bacterium]|nr:hypothetical protein [Polyangiaceae bacterium]
MGTGGVATGGTGGLDTGGTTVATGGLDTGGTTVATGGLDTGGTTTATGGITTGGTSAATGGRAAGGTSAVTGGRAAGGTSAATGGRAAGGTSAATGGRAAGGTSAATGGADTGGTSAATGGADTGGTSAATGGASTGGTGSSSGPVFHIFMLMGQSNMAGVAKNEAGDRNTDERLKVLGGCNQPAGQWNVANPPLNDCPGEKGWNPSDSVGPGMWFGKTLLERLPEGDTIGLVGTAESGESINTFISGGSHHQMILNKINTAKKAENARFAGIIFHQGESDSGQSSWPDKVVQLYNEVKQAFGVDYDVPFILGELPQGGCCGGHNTLVHQAADKLPMGYWVSQEGTKVLDQYHFDHASVVLMGQRYGETMIEALGW